MSGKGIIGGVIGAVAGFIVAGPYGAVLGGALGLAVGMAMDPMQPDVQTTPGQSQTYRFQIPLADLGDPLPDFIGTVKVAGYVIQSWNHRVVELTEQQSSPGAKGGGGESTQTVVVGYEHYLSWLQAFAYGPEPATSLLTVLFDDKPVWYGTLTDNDFDGEETVTLGGVSGESLGSMTFYFGTSNQVANSKVGAALDNQNYNTAYRGLVFAFFDDVKVGNQAKMPSVKVLIRKLPVIPDIGSTPLEVINDMNYNPAHAIWYLSKYHAEIDDSFLDRTTFGVCATYFKNTDYIGVSMFIDKHVETTTYIEGIISHVGAYIIEADGLIKLGVLRDDVDEDDMENLNETNSIIAVPPLTIGSWEDTFNDVKIAYSKINHYPTLPPP